MAAEQKPKDLLSALASIDRRILYILLFLVVAYPILNPFGLPLRVSPEVAYLHSRIDALKSGDVLLMGFDYSASGSADIHPQTEAILRHVARKDAVKVVAVSFWEDGPMFIDRAIRILELAGKKYGTDYVNLGYRTGGESAIARFAEDMRATFPRDFRGGETANLPVMQNVNSIKDVTLAIDFSGGSPGPREWIRQVQAPYRKDLAIGVSTSMVPALLPYYESKQVISILGGLRGAAEYEVLIKELGKGAAGMGSQTMGHLLIIAFLIIGNIGFLASRRQRGQAK